jgi:FtsH-binding integral membrane protein
MKTAKWISALGVIAMTGIIAYAFIVGDFGGEGSRLLAMPWGQVSMVDLYTGFILFSMWIFYREKTIWKAILWTVLMMTLGFFTGSLYTLIALIGSKGDWAKFFMGDRKPEQ